MDKVSFRANINVDYFKVKEGMLFDSYFYKAERKEIKRTINEIGKLSSMKEKSSVNIEPRLDNNQLNLITRVTDKTGEISTIIPERSARKISTDENFAKRYVSNIKQAIINVDITRRNLKQIRKAIKESKNIQDSGLTAKLPPYMLENLKQGNNPTKRIISIIKKIEKQYPNEINKVSIQRKRNPEKPNSAITTYFVLENSQGEKRIPIQNLLRDPAQKLFA